MLVGSGNSTPLTTRLLTQFQLARSLGYFSLSFPPSVPPSSLPPSSLPPSHPSIQARAAQVQQPAVPRTSSRRRAATR